MLSPDQLFGLASVPRKVLLSRKTGSKLEHTPTSDSTAWLVLLLLLLQTDAWCQDQSRVQEDQVAATSGETPTQSDGSVPDYLKQIKPLLSEKCYSCHGTLKQEAGLRLETRALMLEGEVIVPGHPGRSLILERAQSEGEERMPPEAEGSALSPEQLKLLNDWIAAGAPAPDESPPPAPDAHWAFQVPQRSNLIDDASGNVRTHPIDRILQRQRSERGLDAATEVERTLLIRRLYLDLIGLPPSEEELNDDRPIEVLVDDLLSRPQYGERWGRHFMDLWRYSDWYGLGQQLRYSQKHLWHWRDWIVQSLNDDKGYDRMILEMLAADEVTPGDPQTIAATGFLARNYYLFNRTTWLDATIEHTGKAFLGLTFNCAKCHDHKYDPVSQLDYYRMRAIFEPHQVRLDAIPGVADFEKDGLPRVFDDHVDLKTFLHRRGDPKQPDKSSPVEPGFPDILSRFAPAITPVHLPASAYAPGTRESVRETALEVARTSLDQAESAFRKAQTEWQQNRETPSPPGSDPSSRPSDLLLQETFDRLDNDRWVLHGQHWKLSGGTLRLTQSTRERDRVELKTKLPQDFQVECVYTTTGGDTWRSVTFRFDESEDGRNSSAVYTSAHKPGPKVQVTFMKDGNSVYPPEGRTALPIQTGQKYRLRFAVRGRLVNVHLDDTFVLAYELPERRPGSFSLSGFDATVDFDELTIHRLSKDQPMMPAGTKPSAESLASSADPERHLELTRLKRAHARAVLNEIEATIAADRFRYGESDDTKQNSPATSRLAVAAARAQLRSSLAQADLDLFSAGDDAKKRKAASDKQEGLRKRLADIDEEQPKYRSLRGSRKALESPADKEPDYPAAYSPVSTGRRTALARWITSEQNPLTARVIVNHVWMRHFGTPLVEQVFDFGLRCDRPIQAELLDHLAHDLMHSDWSLKHLHRTIATSKAYRMSSALPGPSAGDPSNQYYTRGNTKRMESQLIRDSLLSLAGQLDDEMGGPSVPPNSNSRRRGIYLQHSRDQQDQFLNQFDDADIFQCYRRSESIVPQQALALYNSRLAIEMSAAIADRIVESLAHREASGTSSASPDDDTAFAEAAFSQLLCRQATGPEMDRCMQFLSELNQLASVRELERQDRTKLVRSRLVQALINHHDFISIR